MSKIKQILQAYTEGVSKSMISKKIQVSRNTVKRFIREFIAMDKFLEEILSMSDSALELLFKANPTHEHEPRYKALIAFFPEVDKALKKKGSTITVAASCLRRLSVLHYIHCHPIVMS